MGTYTPDSWDDPCRRCGAGSGEPCEPVSDRHLHATVLRPHPERGMRPWQLKEAGYVEYTMQDAYGDLYHLVRKPTQPRVEHAGWHEVTNPPM